MNSVEISLKEKHSRNLALEEDYVHQIYEKIGKDLVYSKNPLEDTVNKFLDDIEPGSLVADIGCGDGRNLQTKASFCLGADNSYLQTDLARQRCQEVMLADNLRLPFRGDAFDAVLSIAVIHHLTTRERRIKALKELTRILKIGGRVFIAVQKQNSQMSQDVLIPWFDGEKSKTKDQYCLGDDEDEVEFTDEDDESFSLSSSDEDDVSLNFAKFISSPSHFYSKHGSISDSQAHSFDCDCQASSNNVPNSKQIVQVNTCYTFVQKALKRLSSANDIDEDPYLESDLCPRSDSLFASSEINEQKKKVDFCKDGFSNFDGLIQKTIKDNFIELLNIDDNRSHPTFFHRKDSFISMKQPHQSSTTNKNKGTVIRSLSDMFKNMNSSFSKKAAHSCSDLKSHAVQSDDCGREKMLSRLVRSKSTATCKPEFDYCSMLEDIEELDMTISEATKIINDFLESSVPTVQTVKFNNNSSNKSFTSLTQSDIVNGNILPFVQDSQMSNMVQEKFQLEEVNCQDETNSVRKDNEAQNENKLIYMLPDSTCVPDIPEKFKNDVSTCPSSTSYENEISNFKSADEKVENTSMVDSESLFSRHNFNTKQQERSDVQYFNRNNSFAWDSYSYSNIPNSTKKKTQDVKNNTGYRFIQPNSPKKIRKMTQNCDYQLAGSETLGAFNGENNHGFRAKDYSVLSSYYSMPELHALSDFHLEYNLYQNSLLRTPGYDEAYPVEKSKDLAVAEMPHNIKLAENGDSMRTDNFIQFCSKSSLLKNTFESKLYNECIKMGLDNSVDTDFKVSSFVEKPSLCNGNASDDTLIKNIKKSIPLVPTPNAELNPTEFFNLNNKCRSLITIDMIHDAEETSNNFVTDAQIKISRSHSTGGMLSDPCKTNHGSLIDIPTNQHYYQSSYLNLNKINQIHNSIHSSISSNDILNNRFVEAYLHENNALLEKDIHDTYEKCAFYNKIGDIITPSSQSQNKIKNISYCNLNEPRNIQFNQASYINDEIFKKTSRVNDHICPDLEITSPQWKNVSTTCKENNNSDENKFNLSHFLTRDLKSNEISNNNKDLHCQDINSLLLNSQDALEMRFLEEDLCNTFKSNKSAICSTTFFSKKNSPSIAYANLNKGCIDLMQNSSDLGEQERRNLESDQGNSSENIISQQNILSLASPFLSKNISQNKLCGSINCQKSCVFNKSNTQNGARTIANSEMPIKSNVNNLTLGDDFVSTVANQVRHLTPSTDLTSKISNEQNNIAGVDQRYVDSRDISYQEDVDHTYGRVHKEGAVVVCHRYHHLFQEEELEELIENNVNELHILRSFQCESHWCVIAEKVRVWTI